MKMFETTPRVDLGLITMIFIRRNVGFGTGSIDSGFVGNGEREYCYLHSNRDYIVEFGYLSRIHD